MLSSFQNLQQAMTLLNGGEPGRALQRLEGLTDLPGVHFLRAQCLSYVGRNAEALVAAQAERAQNPELALVREFIKELKAIPASVRYPQRNPAQGMPHPPLRFPTTIADPAFQTLLAQIRPNTLLSEARLFSLYVLARQICLEDKPGDFVECGTYRGGSACLLGWVVAHHSQRPRRVWAFDTFGGMPEPQGVDQHWGIPAEATGIGAGALKAPLEKYLLPLRAALGLTEIVEPVAGFFADTLPEGLPETIALLHADADWYQSTMEIFEYAYPRVIPGGIVQVDDYHYWAGCPVALHEFEARGPWDFMLRSVDDTAVWFPKLPPDPCQTLVWQAQTQLDQGNLGAALDLSHAALAVLPDLIAAHAILNAVFLAAP